MDNKEINRHINKKKLLRGFYMKRVIIVFFVLFGLFSIVSEIKAQSKLQVGVVDLQKIVSELPEAKEAEEQLKELSKKYQDTLLQMQEDLEEKNKQYQKQKSMMSPDKQQQEEESIQTLYMQWQQYREEKFGQMGELNQRRMDLLDPIEKRVRKAVEKVAKEEGLDIVVNNNPQNLLYFSEKFDITFKVLDRIKRGEKDSESG